MAGFSERLKHAWNAFVNQPEPLADVGGVTSYGSRPDRTRLRITNERSIISSIYTRLAIDVAQNEMRHVRLDDQDRYIEDIDSGLNNCLTLEANVDQGARALRQDIAMTLFDKGVIAVVPVDTTIDPRTSGAFDVKTMRVGEIVQWYPRHVKVSVYNESKGIRDDIILEKRFVAIVENPLYSVMNEPNSTLQRLISKLNMLDAVDAQSSSGKLDLIIQLPYVVKSEARRQQAEQRRTDIEFQLKGSQYGIAYTDGTEKITQLNRPAENNLLAQVEYLTEMLYVQLGLTKEVMNGTADEAAMLNYMNRTILPILDAIVEAMRRTFLTKTARSQKQTIMYFHDPFKLVPIASIADIADKFVRNEILTKNEIRGIVGYKPSKDRTADKLSNPNMPVKDQVSQPTNPQDRVVVPMRTPQTAMAVATTPKGVSQNGS
jgi:Phage portal protein